MKCVTNPSSGAHRRQGNTYLLTADEIQQYNDLGYLTLNEFLTEEELATLDPWFEHFIMGNEPGMERDFCDMSQPYGTPFEEFRLVNAMLPSKYRPELVNNIYHQVAQSVANQLYTGKAMMDYEQFLAKKPQKDKAEFAMHQDLGYWPKTANTWTATFSLALTDSDLVNGCLQVCPGTNKEPELRKHRPKEFSGDQSGSSVNRDESHTLVIETRDTDEIVYLPVKRGGVTIHDERIVHGSGGNLAKEWRKTYVMAFRDEETVKQERAMGFTHSHNDQVNWEEIIH
ncbi:MAG TPA: phytanoyl-CoA dioxygenase family protein [Pirellulaceae bacterium]|nr:phytanoyl-CoA dioxygenase family protein [Pirellulaceae bacterium]HMO91693.1 phytanoyl-CoA dioxygenase family protein [Pirellulaceae bacterium]HMP68390.1 phytanoyl-CoA dioxygenase family protein [Pirellulaceae bacterium]